MEFYHDTADVFVPDGSDIKTAMARTTHLSITAHQDDTEIGAIHGIITCFGRQDKWFTGVTMTNGASSPRAGIYKDFTDEQMIKVRHDEQRKAAMIGEYSAHFQLDYTSSELKGAAAGKSASDILKILIEANPSVVYLHNPADKHETHVAVCLRSLEALRQLPAEKRPKKVYGCEVWRDLDWMMDDEKQVLPVSDDNNIAAALISVFDSQVAGGKRYDLASAGRRLANATYFASHNTDDFDGINYAMDLTPLVEDPSLSIVDYVVSAIERFKSDVQAKISKLSCDC